VAAPVIPRAAWATHAHFPEQTLLLDSLEAFRRRRQWMLDSVRHVEPGGDGAERKRRRWLSRLGTEFDWWMAGMKAHERYEETKLYPYLERRWDTSLAEVAAGHLALDERKRQVREAFAGALAATDPSRGAPGTPAARVGALLAALGDHRRTLLDHLELEEDAVIPMLLALEPAEFRHYLATPARVLLASPP
jgi:hypothetical protein